MTRTNNLFGGAMHLFATVTIIALLLSLFPGVVSTALAASTGITVSPTTLTTSVSTRVNFQASVVKDGAPTQGTYVSVTDNSGGGSFFDSNGTCSNATPDADNQFSIQNNKNICYSNGTAGVYTITVQLLNGLNGSPIGEVKTVAITVEVPVVVELNPQVALCHVSGSPTNPYSSITTDAKSVVNHANGHGSHINGGLDDVGDIIPPFTYNFDGSGLTNYPGLNWTRIYTNGLTGEQIYNGGGCDGKPAVPVADLAIAKTVSTTTPNEGSTVVYTLTVTNTGPDAATGVVVSDPLATGLTYQSATVVPTNNSPLTWNVGSLAKDASWTVDVTVLVGADQGGNTISNKATVDGTVTDADTANDESAVTINPLDVLVVVPGCTDNDAVNYNQSANRDDGSCVYSITVNKVIEGKTLVTPDQFSFTVNGTGTTTFSATGSAVVNVANGTYAIVEVPVDGFRVSYSGGCSNLVVADSPANCTITNTVINEEAPVCRVGKNLLSNGSFEDPAVEGSWGIFGTVSDWVISLSDGLELWRNFMGGASDGAQNAELDGNSSTRVTQAVTTVPGATYELRFDFSPRPGTSLSDNSVDALVDGTALMNVSGDGSALSATKWTTYSQTFVADGSSTVIGFEDRGSGQTSYGSLVDNAVLCFVSEPEVSTYKIEGYAWHDDNRNQIWDGYDNEVEIGDTESPLVGWVISITNGTTTYSTTTDAYGYYYFEVEAGTWVITEEVQTGWMRTTVESYTVTVPEEVMTSNNSIFDFDWLVPTAHAAVVGTYGFYDFGNDTEDSVTSTTPSTSGGGGRSSTRPRSRVLGEMDSPLPTPQVLGEQVSVVPVGAPDTGRGGSSSQAPGFNLNQILIGTRKEELES